MVFHKPLIHLLLIVILGVIVYSNSFHVPFQFDDVHNLAEKPYVRDIRSFLDFFSGESPGGDHGFRMRPVGYLTFALNYKAGGTNVAGYHAVNLGIHIINALLVYWLVSLSFRTPALKGPWPGDSSGFTALFPALLFVCHPLQTQAVTYIVQRLASLATLFYLLSLVTYIRWRLSPGEGAKKMLWYAVSLISAVLGMKTKEIAFTLPLVMALYEFMFLRGGTKRRVLPLLPFLLTMIIIPAGLVGISRPVGEVISDVSELTKVGTAMTRGEYLLTEFRVIVTYLRLLFLPVNQNLDYDYPVFHGLFNAEVLLSSAVLLAIAGAGLYLLYRSGNVPSFRLISFGIFWFFITLSVESSIIPIADVIFEHRLYLPSVGFFISFIASVFAVKEKIRTSLPSAGTAIMLLLISSVLILSAAAYVRNAVWHDEITLWTDVAAKSPRKPRVYNNLGISYSEKGDYESAIEEYRKALSIKPDYVSALFNLAIAYASEGKTDSAIEYYKEVLRLQPGLAKGHFNLGVSFLSKKMIDEARAEFEAALRIDPNFYQARRFLDYAKASRK